MPAGAVYYRLRMTDNNNKVAYSKVIQLQTSSKALSFDIFPNPATEKITVSYPSGTNGSITLYTAQGKLVKQMILSSNASQVSIALDGLAKGVYYLNWQSGSEKVSKAFIVK